MSQEKTSKKEHHSLVNLEGKRRGHNHLSTSPNITDDPSRTIVSLTYAKERLVREYFFLKTPPFKKKSALLQDKINEN